MQAVMPFFESAEDALKTAITALGGTKQVGPLLWPDKSVEAAGRLLNDCLNPSRAEKLEITQVMFVLRQAKEAGCHEPFKWLAFEVGYEAKPVVHAEQVDKLTSVIEQSTMALTRALNQLEKLNGVGQ